MSAANSPDRQHDQLSSDHVTHADTLAVLVRIALALERLGSALRAPDRPVDLGPAHDLFSLDRIATHLGVSKRWVQRHLRPTIRSGPRGKAWYRLEDVEAQVVCRGASTTPNASRDARTSARGPLSKSPRPSSDEVAAVESELRLGLAKPARRPR